MVFIERRFPKPFRESPENSYLLNTICVLLRGKIRRRCNCRVSWSCWMRIRILKSYCCLIHRRKSCWFRGKLRCKKSYRCGMNRCKMNLHCRKIRCGYCCHCVRLNCFFVHRHLL